MDEIIPVIKPIYDLNSQDNLIGQLKTKHSLRLNDIPQVS